MGPHRLRVKSSGRGRISAGVGRKYKGIHTPRTEKAGHSTAEEKVMNDQMVFVAYQGLHGEGFVLCDEVVAIERHGPSQVTSIFLRDGRALHTSDIPEDLVKALVGVA
jgi:hypothetical protein